MADEQEKKPKKIPRRRKSPETVRERAEKQSTKKTAKQPGRVKKTIYRPLSVLRRTGAKEFNPVKVPSKNKAGKVLNKRFSLIPNWLRKSWAEMKLVTWPTPKEAARLTFAVIVFATVFAIVIQLLDFVFNKLFKEILLR